MALTTPDPPDFLNVKNTIFDLQLHNAVDAYAHESVGVRPTKLGDESLPEDVPNDSVKLPSYNALCEEVRRLKNNDLRQDAKILGLKNYWSYFYQKHWNPMCDRTVQFVGFEHLSDPKANLLNGGGFRTWDAGLTTPDGWTVESGVTVSRQSARTGAMSANYSARVLASGTKAGITQSITNFQPGRIHTLSFYLNLEQTTPSTQQVYVELTSTGASTNLALSYVFVGDTYGASAWFGVPGAKIQGMPMSFEVPSDATGLTLAFRTEQNGQFRVSDVALRLGPQVNADLWAPGYGDISDISGGATGIEQLYADLNANATTAVTSEETLASYTMPADTFSDEDQALIITAWGRFASNTNQKTVRLRFGSGSVVLATNDITPRPNGSNWTIRAEIGLRTAPSTWSGGGEMTVGAVQQSAVTQFPNDAMTGTITIVLSGQNGTASANDIVCDGFRVEFTN